MGKAQVKRNKLELKEAERGRLAARQKATGNRGICRNFRFAVTGTTLKIAWQDQPAVFAPDGGDDILPTLVLDGSVTQEEQSVPLSTAPVMQTEDVIEERDVVLIALWMAARCMLWLNSGDSLLLVKFVNKLDRHVFVM